MLRKEPGIIVGPISKFFGFFVNLIYEAINFFATEVFSFGLVNSLGIAIIIFTAFTRICMLPIAFKQQKSMQIMRKIQPKMKKIQDKYKGCEGDPELQRKMNMEMQKLYSENNYNPFGGCLPLLIQFPIFIAIYYIMQNPNEFINIINDLYLELATSIQGIDGYVDAIRPLAVPLVPKGMTIDIANSADLAKVLSKLTPENWEVIQSSLNITEGSEIFDLITIKHSIETFLGLNLVETVGWSFPKVLIPIFSGVTTYLSSMLMTKRSGNTDPNMVRQQKTMNIIMPIFMVWITTSLPGGVGIYWITSNVFQMIQQVVLNKVFDNKEKKEEAVL